MQVSNVNYRKQKFQFALKSCFTIVKGEDFILRSNSTGLDWVLSTLVKDIYECYVGIVQHKEFLYMLHSQNSIMITASLFIVQILRTWQIKIL